MKELRYCVLHLGKQKIDATVFDEANGCARDITVTWKAKDATDTPPTSWVETVEAELENMRGQDHDPSASFKQMMRNA